MAGLRGRFTGETGLRMKSRTSGLRPSFVALALATLVVAAPAARADGKVHRDKANKFSFSYPDDWDPVPLEPGEKDAVAKFIEKKADAKGITPAEVTVYRLGTATKPVLTGDTPGDGPDEEPPSSPYRYERPRATDLIDMANEQLKFGFFGQIDRTKGKAITSRDDVPGMIHTFDARSDYQSQFMVLATWEKPGEHVQYGMWLRATLDRKKKLELLFKNCVSSFRWFDEKAKDVDSLSQLDGVNISAAKRSEIERGIVAGWKVIVSPKKNYIVIYNTVKERNNLLAKIIADNIEMIREQIYEKQFPPKKKIEDVCIVRVCGGRAEYHAYGGPGGSAGYWSTGTEELVFYDASPARAVDDDTISVLYHEAFHQYIYYSTGRVSPHSWFNEGHGDYYAGAKLIGRKFVIKPFTWRMGTIKNALRMGPSPVEGDGFDRTKEGYTPLEPFTAFTQGQYYSYPGISYAQGWSFIYFLRELVPKNPKWNAKWGKILETYFNVLQNSTAVTPSDPKPAPAPEPKPEPKPGPGKGEPGMDSPGMGGTPPPDDEPLPPDDPTEEPPMGFAMPTDFGDRGGNLKRALEEAFKGIDWKDLETTWRKAILELNG